MFNGIEKIVGPALYLVAIAIGIIGCGYLFSTFIIIPNKQHARTINAFRGKDEKQKTNPIDVFFETFSEKYVAPRIHLNDIRRSEMEKSLLLAKNPKTPEMYVGYIYTVCATILILAVFMSFIKAFLGIIMAILAVVCYIYNMRKLTNNKRANIAKFEKELPKFVAYLKQAMKTNDNVISCVENYKTNNIDFSTEITATIADAKTSNFESALARLDQKINSDRLKMVIHGLVSAYHGDDTTIYFAMLEKDFTAFEINDLKKSIKTIPQKMQFPKILIFSAIAFALFAPLLIQIYDSFKSIFETM